MEFLRIDDSADFRRRQDTYIADNVFIIVIHMIDGSMAWISISMSPVHGPEHICQ